MMHTPDREAYRTNEAEALGDLPEGAVVLDKDGDAWQLRGDTMRFEDGERLQQAWYPNGLWCTERSAYEMVFGSEETGPPLGPFVLLWPIVEEGTDV